MRIRVLNVKFMCTCGMSFFGYPDVDSGFVECPRCRRLYEYKAYAKEIKQ